MRRKTAIAYVGETGCIVQQSSHGGATATARTTMGTGCGVGQLLCVRHRQSCDVQTQQDATLLLFRASRPLGKRREGPGRAVLGGDFWQRYGRPFCQLLTNSFDSRPHCQILQVYSMH
jgi:hypothetical protein